MNEQKSKPNLEVDTAAALLAFRSSGKVSTAGSHTTLVDPATTDSRGMMESVDVRQQQPDASRILRETRAQTSANGTQIMDNNTTAAASAQLPNAALLLLHSHTQSAASRSFIGSLAMAHSLQNPVVSSYLAPKPAMPPQPISAPGQASCSTSNVVDIRQEEVEKALKSKPQRGRKRSNLNQDERQELARTRNREHAKSTRIRKKQRLQELLEIERKHEQVQQRMQLCTARKESALEFLRLRCDEHFQDSEETRSPPSEGQQQEGEEKIRLLEPTMTYADHEHGSVITQGGYEVMKQRDLLLKSLAVQQFGKDCVVEIHQMEVALTLDSDVSLVEVDYKVLDRVIRSSLVKIVYTSGCNKIASVKETNLNLSLGDISSLATQVSFPSVVSLDDNKTAQKRPENAQPSGDAAGGGGGLFI